MGRQSSSRKGESASPPSQAESQLEVLVDRFLTHLILERGYSAHTVSAYATDLRVWLEESGAGRPADLDQELVSLILTRWMGDYSLSTVSRRLSALRSFARFCRREGMPLALEEKRLRVPRSRQLPGVLTVEEVERVIEMAEKVGGEFRLRDRAMVELLYSSGLRASELITLRITDVILEEGLVIVRGGKNRKDRVVPLGRRATEAIQDYLKDLRPRMGYARKSDRLFLGRKGPLSRVHLYRIVSRAARLAGIDRMPVGPHTLRHSCATHMVENGADLVAVKELLGHSSLNTVEIYTHLSQRHLREVYERTHPWAAGR